MSFRLSSGSNPFRKLSLISTTTTTKPNNETTSVSTNSVSSGTRKTSVNNSSSNRRKPSFVIQQQTATSTPRKKSTPLFRRISSALAPPQHLLSTPYEKQERKHRKISAALVENRQRKLTLPVLAASTGICAQDKDRLRKLSFPLATATATAAGIKLSEQFVFDDSFALLPPMKPKSLSVREKLHLAFFGDSSKSQSSNESITAHQQLTTKRLQKDSSNTLSTSSELSNGSLDIDSSTNLITGERLGKLSSHTLTTLSKQSDSASTDSITHRERLEKLKCNNTSITTTSELSNDGLSTSAGEIDTSPKTSSTPRLRKTGLFTPGTPKEGRRTANGSTTQKTLHFLGLTTPLCKSPSDLTAGLNMVNSNDNSMVCNNDNDSLSSSSTLDEHLILEETKNSNSGVLTQMSSLESVVTTSSRQPMMSQESRTMKNDIDVQKKQENLFGVFFVDFKEFDASPESYL